MNRHLHNLDLRALNSATKYPSIPTYHVMGDRGALTDERVPITGRVIAREKIDGTNARIILTRWGYFIGSREELLYFQGDLLANPAQQIVEAVKPLAERLGEYTREGAHIAIAYVEAYGGKTSAAAKQYTGAGTLGFRLFDIAFIDRHVEVLDKGPEGIARWRDAGGQRFLDDADLARAAVRDGIPIAPIVYDGDAAALGASHEEAWTFLRRIALESGCALDDRAGGRAEGVVVRTPDRRVIVKLRHEDYERTLRRRRP